MDEGKVHSVISMDGIDQSNANENGLDDSFNSDNNLLNYGDCEEYQNANPWPNLKEIFAFVLQQKNNLHFKCKLCPSSKKPLSTFRHCIQNFSFES